MVLKREERHSAILQLITKKPITTQSMLTEELKNLGYKVTQATVSRDIEQLGLIKVNQKNEKSIYSKPFDAKLKKIISLFHQSVLSISGVKNFIVIKTISGGASSACIIIDSLEHPEILGSIAGDDTVLVIIKNEDQLDNIITKLQNLMDEE